MSLVEQHSQYFSTLNSIRIPKIARAVALILVIAAVAIGLFLTFVPWVQTTAGSGQVTALNPNDRQQQINALVSGRIEEWFVRDGSAVKAGDPIVKIVDNDPNLLERLESERQQVLARKDAIEAALKTAKIDLRRTKELFDKGLAARREYEQAQISVENMRARVAVVAAELSRINVRLSRQSAQLVKAPRDGVILSVNAGDEATFVNAGQVVATFVPENIDRAVEVFIDGRDVALVKPGDKARIQFEGWPAVQFSGWPSIAIGTFPAEVVSIDPSAGNRGRFRVLLVEPENADIAWPDRRFIHFGTTMRAWILLDTVTVGYELWRQLNNFPPSFPNNSTTSQSSGA